MISFLLHFFLSIALLAFGLDLAHMIFHLAETPSLWQIEGVPFKLLAKAVTFLIPLLIFVRRKKWMGLTVAVLMAAGALGGDAPKAWAASRCEQARELLTKSGVSRDAKENFFGHLKVKPPHGSFPEDMDKITWWGEFQPFDFWSSPEFQAVWINPQGREVARRNFKGSKCRLAKATIRGEDQPRGQFQSGMWKVRVTCEDYLIDQQSFAVTPSGPPSGTSPDRPRPREKTVMIWAEDAVR